MPAPLLSQLWYRVAATHPRVRGDVRVERQRSRDRDWYVLVNEATGGASRINAAAYRILGRCDGRSSVAQIWDSLLEELQDDAPTQDEVIAILSQLDRQGLLSHEGVPDMDVLVRNRDERQRRRRRGLLNPFALQIALGDPSVLLERLRPLGRILCHPLTLVVWLAAMLAAAAATAVNWSSLSAHAAAQIDTPRSLLLAWLAFPFIKGLHELGHGLALRHWGGEVHRAGLTLFVLTPAPYVDASAAAALRGRSRRALISAIGIMVELALAALGLVVWLNVQPGTLSDLAFVVMCACSVSTLLFNGNPLLKFDAYYLLCDALDLPNLASRSRAFWAQCLRRVAFGANARGGVEPGKNELGWLIVYAPLSAAYRLLAAGGIVFWVGSHSFVLGVVAGCSLAVALVLKPAYGVLRELLAAPAGVSRWRGTVVVLGAATTLFLVLGVVPMPWHTSAPAVVWLPDQAQVRAETDGFVIEATVRDGARVDAGQVLLVLSDPQLVAHRAELASQLEQLQTEITSALLRDAPASTNFEREQARITGELQQVDEKLSRLRVRAQCAGRLVMPRQEDLPGSFVRRGSTLGYILDGADVAVRAAVPEYDAALVRERTRSVQVRMADASDEIFRGQFVREVPAATRELPSAALSDHGGGPFLADAQDKEGLRISQPVVLVDLKLPAERLQRVGGHAWVRFDHGAEALAAQWYRRSRQLLLQHFDPTG